MGEHLLPSAGVVSTSNTLGVNRNIVTEGEPEAPHNLVESQCSDQPDDKGFSCPIPDSKSSDDPTESEDEKAGAFDLSEFLQQGILERRTTAGGPAKKLGVCFRNFTVKGVISSSTQVKTLPIAVINTFGPDLYRIMTDIIPALKIRSIPTRDLIHDFTGSVNSGEMMLVLGRPGSGCSTFLKSIANHRTNYAAVEGDVRYGVLSAEEQRQHYRGEVVYNEEDDRHFPNLTVWRTLQLALENKTRSGDRWSIPAVLDSFLETLGIPHIKHTVVGNEFVRGKFPSRFQDDGTDSV